MATWIDHWLPLLRCPVHQAPLRTDADAQHLVCEPGAHRYPLVDGIACFLDAMTDADPESTIKRQEIAARDQVADGYTSSYSEQKNRLEIPPCLNAMSPEPSDVVVELGCGTGRITVKYVPQVAGTVAIDFSLQSLRHLRKVLPASQRDRVLLIHGDICSPPLAPGQFSKAVSFQVLEHLPSPESRLAAFRKAAQLLRPGGDLVCTVYNWSLEKQLDARRGLGDDTQKQGFHDTGIFYYNFEEHELRQMFVEAGLQLELLAGIRIPIPGGRILGPLSVLMNRLLSRTTFGIRRAHLLLGRGRNSQSRN